MARAETVPAAAGLPNLVFLRDAHHSLAQRVPHVIVPHEPAEAIRRVHEVLRFESTRRDQAADVAFTSLQPREALWNQLAHHLMQELVRRQRIAEANEQEEVDSLRRFPDAGQGERWRDNFEPLEQGKGVGAEQFKPGQHEARRL